MRASFGGGPTAWVVAATVAATAAVPLAAVAQSQTVPAAAYPPLPAQADEPGWNWADDTSTLTQAPEFANSKAICRRVRKLEPPVRDWPDAKTAATLAGCDASALYYGIGRPANPVRARQCALLQAQHPGRDDGPFSGIGMLMTIYANGRGAPRNLELATSLACRVEGAPAELDGRIKHLQQLEAKPAARREDFDYCDDITSGMAGGLCAARDADMADVKRADMLSGLAKHWTAQERRAFASLETAADAYAKASGENEVDLGGTGRVAFELGQEQQIERDFVDLLKKLEAGEAVAATGEGDTAADARLNDVYRRIMAMRTGEDGRIDDGTVTKDGIRTAQRAWLRYRDAWVAFAALRYRGGRADGLRAVLIRRRIDELKDFLPSPQ